MINLKSSILYSITFIFFISISAVVSAFLFLIKYDQQKYMEELNTKYSMISKVTLFYLSNFIMAQELEEQIKNYKMQEITEESLSKEILTKGEVLDILMGKLGKSTIVNYDSDNYLIITRNGINLLLKDLDYQSHRYTLIKVIFAFVLIIILIAYFLTIRKIRPLKRLKKQIDKFAKGDFKVPSHQTGTDEIAEVANAFYDSAKHIQKMNHSRQLFLRNIMHELKTPITKGRISAEMIENPKQKHRLITVFERLETMINEFASIERLTSGIGLANMGTYRLIDIFDEAIDLAMVERESIELCFEKDMSLRLDFKLFSLAVKNLIDNGIKYSTNKRVTIVSNETAIYFISKGEKLDKPLEHYLSPFTQGNNSTKSLGLGLYIVDNIIKAHKLEFIYKYENGQNIFIIKGLNILKDSNLSSVSKISK